MLGPILGSAFGAYAPLVMLMLCAVAYAFGSAIRFNIASIEKHPDRHPFESALETGASWILAFAYVISVAYYLNLLGLFGVSLTPLDTPLNAKLLTSFVFVLILFVGWTKGFAAMERMEQVSVSLKLAIIAGLLVGMLVFFSEQAQGGTLILDEPVVSFWPAIALGFGLIVTVQGFEASRYLGNTYTAGLRIRSMKAAQVISTIIYISYIVLLTYAFDTQEYGLNETAIIDMMALVAPILPALLVVAALSAQFSAAVADTSGTGGLLNELSRSKVSTRQAYALLVVAGLMITWFVNLFDIIAYASRAFALYYGIQAAIAMHAARRTGVGGLRVGFYASLAVLGVLMAVLGATVEQ